MSNIFIYFSNLWTTLLLFFIINKMSETIIKKRILVFGLIVLQSIILTIINVKSTSIMLNLLLSFFAIQMISFFFRPYLRSLYVSIYFFIVHLLIEDIVILVMIILSDISYMKISVSKQYIILNILVELLFILCLFSANKWILIITEENPIFHLWLISFSLVSIAMMAIHISSINSLSTTHTYISSMINSIILLVISQFLLYAFSKFCTIENINRNNQELRQTSSFYAKSLELEIEESEITRRKNHDFSNFLHTILILIKDNNKLEAISLLENKLQIGKIQTFFSKTGLRELDEIINIKMMSEYAKNVEIKLMAEINESLQIPSDDFVILFGNLLDNALEAAAKLNKPVEIKVTIKVNCNILYIKIENPYCNELQLDSNGNFLSSKDNKEHGYGIRSIVNIVEKHNGEYSFVHNVDMFVASTYLYQKK